MKNDQFKALMLEKAADTVTPHIQHLALSDLPPGDVTIDVHYSSLNYKDAMAIANLGIIRQFPAIPGIDLAGVITSSNHPDYRAGDEVILTGWGVGERHWGGYSQKAKAQGEWLVHLPKGMTLKQSMQIGTAGLTAMLCIDALEQQDITPDKGSVVVTGASGGVGSIALMLLKHLGYQALALTGRQENTARLKALGAHEVLLREQYLIPSKPGRHTMEKESFSGVIDTVGGDMLSALIARVSYGGAIAACGLVGGINLDTTVFPFILRGISLIGIDSVRVPAKKRQQMWARLSHEIPYHLLESASNEITLEEIPEVAQAMLCGKATGRTIVRLQD